MLGIWETLITIIVVVLIVWKLGKKAPEIARKTGESIGEFKKGIAAVPNEIEKVKKDLKK